MSPAIVHVDVLALEDSRAIVFSVAHRPDRCLRCRSALEQFTDHEDVVPPGLTSSK